MPLTIEPPAPEAWLLTREVLDSLPVIRRDPGDGNGDRIEQPVTAAVVPPDADDLVSADPDGDGPPNVVEDRLDLGEAGGREALDAQIARLAGYIVENVPGEPSRSEGAVDCAIRLLGDYLRRRSEWDERSREGRAQVDRLVESNAALRQQLSDFRSSLPGPMPASDAEALVRLREERDEARRMVGSLGRELDACRAQQMRQAATITAQQSLAAARGGTADNFRRLIGRHEPIEVHVGGSAHVTCDGHELLVEYEAAQATTTQTGAPLPVPDPLGDRRPRLDRWPDDAVTLTYPELRHLVALHLDRYCEPGSGRAMREGDVPLRLSEVLDR